MKDTIRRYRLHTNKLPTILLALVLLLSVAAPGRSTAQGDSRTYPETGQTVKGKFLQYWDKNGGLAQQGYPISAEMQEVSDTDGKSYTVQYFERAVFELHPEFAGTENEVLLQLLGTFLYNQKYPQGASAQKASTDNPYKDPVTGKSIGGKFRTYYEGHGGLRQQGRPLSEEFTEVSDLNGKSYTVQYFERAVFELHSENPAPYDVLLSQLGTFRYRAKNTQAQVTATPAPNTPAPTAQAAAPTSTPTGPLPALVNTTFEYVYQITGGGNKLSAPSGIAVDAQGNVFVVDTLNSRVQKFDKAGNFVSMFGGPGRGDGLFRFDEFGGLAIDKQGNVYVANSDNTQRGEPGGQPNVQVFDNNGTFLRKFGGTAQADGGLNMPTDLVMDSKGNVYVLDFWRNRVNKYDTGGHLLKWWASSTVDNIAIDSIDNIYVTSYTTNSVLKYDSEGTTLESQVKTTFVHPVGITIDRQDNIYVTDGWAVTGPGITPAPRVQKFDKYGRLTGTIGGGPASTAEGQLNGPSYLTVDGDGYLYISDQHNSAVLKFRQK